MDQFNDYLHQFANSLVAFVPNLISAVITLVIGLLIIKFFRSFITRLMTKKQLDPTLLKFIMDVLTWVFRVLLFVSVITKLGVETSSFVAAIGAAGLAIGLSLQGSLSNFAGGLLIILFKPIRVGDYIEAQGEAGTVSAIRIFNTRLITGNNQVVYLPNGTLSNGTIRNFSKMDTRRAEIILSVAYTSSISKVKKIIEDCIAGQEMILKSPEPVVLIKDFTDTSVRFSVLIWAESAHYGTMVSDFYLEIKKAFDAHGIEAPIAPNPILIKNRE